MNKQELIEMLRSKIEYANDIQNTTFDIFVSVATDLLRELEETPMEVKAWTDDSGHWYIIPNDIEDEFINDLADEEMVDSGQFDNKYGQYRTGGDLNNIQLYADLPQPPKTENK